VQAKTHVRRIAHAKNDATALCQEHFRRHDGIAVVDRGLFLNTEDHGRLGGKRKR
jgi:hypothetical protein